jgi:hypothetical protein
MEGKGDTTVMLSSCPSSDLSIFQFLNSVISKFPEFDSSIHKSCQSLNSSIPQFLNPSLVRPTASFSNLQT